MINFQKFKTIDEVFMHNFEPLRPWRGLICFPERLPDAVRFFIAQQLSDPKPVSQLSVDQPEHKSPFAYAFRDKSVLVLPDEFFEDPDAHHAIVECMVFERLQAIERQIDQLPGAISSCDAIDKASSIIKTLGRFLSWNSFNLVAGWKILNLARALNGKLSCAFDAGARRPSDALKWHEFVEQARKLDFDLELSPAAIARLSKAATSESRGGATQ